MRSRVAIIGGSGVGDKLLQLGHQSLSVPTRFGTIKLAMSKEGFYVVARHAGGHRVPPHKINYLGISSALKTLGVKHCFATAAVGSLRADWRPGKLVVCTNFLDFTGRNLTSFSDEVVHIAYSNPFGTVESQALRNAGNEEIEMGGTYVCANGPRYETPAEIEFYKKIGGDVVGMTASSEAICLREVGIGYGLLAIVTNFGAGLSDDEPSHNEVIEQMATSADMAIKILREAAAYCESISVD